MVDLTLYFLDGCPCCGKVLDYMRKNNISIQMKEIGSNQENKQELIDIGGKSQAPCLVIDNRALYESDEIIKWLQNSFGGK